jgi:putative phosphoribosyl transferase
MENRLGLTMASTDGYPHPGCFADRRDAGRRLAQPLLSLADEDPVVVGLPRGGVPVAAEIATALGARLEILNVRKLGAPQNPEHGIGAIAEDGTRVFDAEALMALGIGIGMLKSIVRRETEELHRRVAAYRGDHPPPSLGDRTVIVVDDGVATGVTDMAALRAIQRQCPRRLILAVPVCPPDSAVRLSEEADELVCLAVPAELRGVSEWYQDFSQVPDHEVRAAIGS